MYQLVSRIVLYCVVLYCIALRCIASHRIASHRIASHRIVSYRIVSYRIVSYRIVSYRIVSYRIVSYRIVLYCDCLTDLSRMYQLVSRIPDALGELQFSTLVLYCIVLYCFLGLNRIYQLVSRIPDRLSEIKTRHETHICARGVTAVEQCREAALNVRSMYTCFQGRPCDTCFRRRPCDTCFRCRPCDTCFRYRPCDICCRRRTCDTCFRRRPCDSCFRRRPSSRQLEDASTHTGRLIVYYAALSNNRRVSDQLGEYSRPCYRRQNPRVGHALLGQLTLFSESKHCSRRRRYTEVESTSPRKCADKTQIIARKRWHGARIY